MCTTSLLLHEEVTKNIGAWCDCSFVSKLTGNVGNYPLCCAATSIENLHNIQKLSLTSIKILHIIDMNQLFTKVSGKIALNSIMSRRNAGHFYEVVEWNKGGFSV